MRRDPPPGARAPPQERGGKGPGPPLGGGEYAPRASSSRRSTPLSEPSASCASCRRVDSSSSWCGGSGLMRPLVKTREPPEYSEELLGINTGRTRPWACNRPKEFEMRKIEKRSLRPTPALVVAFVALFA